MGKVKAPVQIIRGVRRSINWTATEDGESG